MKVKSAVIQNWKKQQVFREEDSKGQSYNLLRWVLNREIKTKQNVSKAILWQGIWGDCRLIPKDTSHCSRIDAWSQVLIMIISQWEIKSSDFEITLFAAKQMEWKIYLHF